ncbi:MAG TPA: 3'(2'),5'-bisphosphate nucleotidase CysQ [Gammaproteobacteria bacterium]|jgi:3'(2'), 5'-bisphosphate nucleotidase|nr:3'(2'),5'-bisphosphate nucleotidase CysQ [Gammaproteobacteria bacterium]
MSDHELLEPLAQIAADAGAAILEIYDTDFAVELKDDRSPLTAADKAAHRIIVAALKRMTPDMPVLSEESAEIPAAERARWSRYWLVDPLDGTKEFIKRNGEFTVNIALIEDGRPVAGVVHAPVKQTTWLGVAGVGASRKTPAGTQPITTRKPPADPVRVVCSRSHRDAQTDAFIATLGPHETVAIGSSLKFCLVAEGSADVYPRFGPTSHWDTAAAHAVVAAAGGAVVNFDGEPLTYVAGDSLLNPPFLVYGDGSRDWLSEDRGSGLGVRDSG